MTASASTVRLPSRTARPSARALPAEVRAVAQVTPNVRRITLGGLEGVGAAWAARAGSCSSAGRVYLEVPSERDAQPLRITSGVHVTWLPRRRGAKVGALAAEAVGAATLPGGATAYALVDTRGVAESAITFTGYWRHGVGYAT